jgi:metallo-beta-lactamase class B
MTDGVSLPPADASFPRSWALVTSDGIIILDTLFTYNSEEEIVGGLKKPGLDPMKVKYVIITNAHADHVGGAKLPQDLTHSKIVMGGPDWDSIDKPVHGYPEGKPKRDITADDGQKIHLGDTPATILTTPGHTPGTLSMIFQVKDNGKPLTVVYSEGTLFNYPSTAPTSMSISSRRPNWRLPPRRVRLCSCRTTPNSTAPCRRSR